RRPRRAGRREGGRDGLEHPHRPAAAAGDDRARDRGPGPRGAVARHQPHRAAPERHVRAAPDLRPTERQRRNIMTGGGWTRRPAVTILALLLAAGGTARGGERPVQPPADSFAAALETHLRAIRERDLEALLDTITTGEKLILVFPDGTLTDSRAEYV